MTRETLDSPLMVVVVVVVAVAESSPWFFSFHGKGDDFCEMVCPRRDGWEGPGRHGVCSGGGAGTTSAADAAPPPPRRTRANSYRALVLAGRVSCVALVSFRSGRRHPPSSIEHGAGG